MYYVEGSVISNASASSSSSSSGAAFSVRERLHYRTTSYSLVFDDCSDTLAEAYLSENNVLSVTVTSNNNNAVASGGSCVTKTFQCPTEAENKINTVKIVRIVPRLLLALISSRSSKLLVLDLTDLFPRRVASGSAEDAAAEGSVPAPAKRALNVSLFSLSSSSGSGTCATSSAPLNGYRVSIVGTLQRVTYVVDLEIAGLCDVHDVLDITAKGSADMRLLLVCSGAILIVVDILIIHSAINCTPLMSRLIIDNSSRQCREIRRVNIINVNDNEITIALHVNSINNIESTLLQTLPVPSSDSLNQRMQLDSCSGLVEDRSGESALRSYRTAGDGYDSETDFYDTCFTDIGSDAEDADEDGDTPVPDDALTTVSYKAIYGGTDAVAGTNPMRRQRSADTDGQRIECGDAFPLERAFATPNPNTNPLLSRGGSGMGEGCDAVCRKGGAYYLYSMQRLELMGAESAAAGGSIVSVHTTGLLSLLAGGPSPRAMAGSSPSCVATIDALFEPVALERGSSLYGVLSSSGAQAVITAHLAEGARLPVASVTVCLQAAAAILFRYTPCTSVTTIAITATDAAIVSSGELLVLVHFQEASATFLLCYRRISSGDVALFSVCEIGGFATESALHLRLLTGLTPKGIFCAGASGDSLFSLQRAAAATASDDDSALLRLLLSRNEQQQRSSCRKTFLLLALAAERTRSCELLRVVANDALTHSSEAYSSEDEVVFEFLVVLLLNYVCYSSSIASGDVGEASGGAVDSDALRVMIHAGLTDDPTYSFRALLESRSAAVNVWGMPDSMDNPPSLRCIIDSYVGGPQSTATATTHLCMLVRRCMTLHGTVRDSIFGRIVIAKCVSCRHAHVLTAALDCIDGFALTSALLRLYLSPRGLLAIQITDILRLFCRSRRVNVLYDKSIVHDIVTLHAHIISRMAQTITGEEDVDSNAINSISVIERTVMGFVDCHRSAGSSCYLDEDAFISKYVAVTFCRLVFLVAPAEGALFIAGDLDDVHLVGRARLASARLSKTFLLELARFVADHKVDLSAM